MAGRWGSRSGSQLVSRLAEMDLHLPPWQRGQVWDGERQRAFCRALWRGLPTAPLLLWEQRVDAEPIDPNAVPDRYGYTPSNYHHRIVVLDGQQRLAALGVPMRRWNGVPLDPPESYLDLEDGEWKAEPMPGLPWPLTLTAVSDPGGYWRAGGDDARRLQELWWQAAQRCRPDLLCYTIPRGTPVGEVIEIFRAWNAPGVPIPPEQIDALIRGADLSWVPPGEVSGG